MTPDGINWTDRVDAYVDGLLDEEDRLAVEARAGQDARLRNELHELAAINDSLRRLFVPPNAARFSELLRRRIEAGSDALDAAVAESVPDDGSDRRDAAPQTPGRPDGICAGGDETETGVPTGQARPRHRVRSALAIAAGLAAAVIGAWLIASSLLPGGAEMPYGERQSVHEAYRTAMQDGFQPDWRCASVEEFMDTFATRFRQPLLLPDQPGVRQLGLKYCNVITSGTVCLLARVEDEPVMVFVDRVEPDRGQSLPEGAAVNLFRRRLGRLVIYELTPREAPALLEHFVSPRPGQAVEGPQDWEE